MSMAGFASVLGTGPQIDLTAANLPPLLLANVNTITGVGQRDRVRVVREDQRWSRRGRRGRRQAVRGVGTDRDVAALDNIAVYTQMTRQLIEDSSAVRSFIDGELQP
jgi:hypothetical protein